MQPDTGRTYSRGHSRHAFLTRTLRLAPDLRWLPRARSFVEEVARETGFPQEKVFRIRVAISEACANAIEHGRPEEEIEVSARVHANRLEIDVFAHSEFQVSPPRMDGENSRGMGLPLMVHLADHLALYSEHGQTLVTLTFYRDGVPRPDDGGPIPPSHIEALEENELVSAMLGATPIGFSVLSPDLRCRWVNPAFRRQLKHSSRLDDLTGLYLPDLLPRPSRRSLVKVLRRVSRSGQEAVFADYEIAGLERGPTFWSIQMLPLGGTPPYDVLLVVSEVTDQVLASEQKNTRERELRQANARLKLLSDTAARLLAAREPEMVVHDVCSEVLEFLGCQTFFIFLLETDEGPLRLNAYAGLPESTARGMQTLDIRVEVCETVALSGTGVLREDIQNSAEPLTDLVRGFGVQAYVCNPLLSQGRVVGTLSFGTRTRAAFSEWELSVMREVADLVSLAMTHKLDHDEVKRSEDKSVRRALAGALRQRKTRRIPLVKD